jgi:hypothetical protein
MYVCGYVVPLCSYSYGYGACGKQLARHSHIQRVTASLI